MADKTLDKRILFYREANQFYADDRAISFSSIPFLKGVGCGMGANLLSLIENAKRAQEQGYRVILISRHLPGMFEYPLHKDDLAVLTEALSHPFQTQ